MKNSLRLLGVIGFSWGRETFYLSISWMLKAEFILSSGLIVASFCPMLYDKIAFFTNLHVIIYYF